MSIPESIIRRKSFHSFTKRELAPELLDELADYISGLTPPYSELDWNFDTLPHSDLMQIATRSYGIEAPTYLVLRSTKKAGCLQNAGYLGEMAILWLAERGVATMWQGSVSVNYMDDFPGCLPYISCIAMGYSDESFRKTAAESDRKPLSSIAFGPIEGFEEYLEAARLAPSYENRQMSRIVADKRGNLHVFRKKALMNNPVLTFQDCIGTGVTLAHLDLAMKADGLAPRIYTLNPEPSFRNFIYQFSIDPGKN